MKCYSVFGNILTLNLWNLEEFLFICFMKIVKGLN